MITWFSEHAASGLPALTLPVEGPAFGTNRCLYVRAGGRVGRIALPGPWWVALVDRGAVCWSERADVLIADEVSVNEDPRVRRGVDVAVRREPGGPWTCEGRELPPGAKWARDLRPFPEGRGLTWSDVGFRYRWDFDGGITAVGRAAEAEPPEVPDPDVPEDAVREKRRIAGLKVLAWRTEGEVVRGWLRDGTVVVERA